MCGYLWLLHNAMKEYLEKKIRLYISVKTSKLVCLKNWKNVHMKEKLKVYLSHLQFNFKIMYNQQHLE